MTGVCLVGAGTGTDSNGVTHTFTARTQVGEYVHTLSTGEMPAHSHTDAGHVHPSPIAANSGSGAFLQGNSPYTTVNTATGNANIQNTGGGGAHNNIMPAVGAYMWYRSA